MGKYFSIEEMCQSETAERLGIANRPSDVVCSHLVELIAFMDGVREWYGMPMIVSSGYRSVKLNDVVGGVACSSHCYGWACDVVPGVGCSFCDMVVSVLDYLHESGVLFDQILVERSGSKRWLHIGLRRWDGVQRCEVRVMSF